jgi:putative transposase
MDKLARTLAHIKRAARALGKHPVTEYRWLENYERSERLSVFLRKKRSDRGASRLWSKFEKIIDDAIKNIYLIAEKPSMAAVTEEVWLQCFKNKIKKKPAPNTLRARILMVSDRLRMEKRDGRKRAAEKYEPIRGHPCPRQSALVGNQKTSPPIMSVGE